MPVAAIVLTLLGDMDYLLPATFFLVVAIDLGQFPLSVVIVPVSTIGMLGCVVMMGAMPKKHVVWGILVLSFASLAIAFDGYILITFPLGIWGAQFVIALGLILVGGTLAIVWKPPLDPEHAQALAEVHANRPS